MLNSKELGINNEINNRDLSYKSPKNKKAQIAILGANHILSYKLYSVLKRNYSVIGLQSISQNGVLEIINLSNLKILFGYFRYNNVKIVVITSEFFMDSIESLDEILDFCKKENMKVIFFSLKYVIEYIPALVDTQLQNVCRKYEKNNGSIIKKIENCPEHLVVEIDCCYGDSDKLCIYDFPSICRKYLKNIKLCADNQDAISPLLADEVALWLSEHIFDTGRYSIKTKEKLSFSEWENCIKVNKGFNRNIQESKVSQSSFSCVQEGERVLEHQRKCCFKLVYKYDPIDMYNGGNVGKIRIALGELLSESIPQDIIQTLDYVCPVPQTGLYYAMGLAKALNVPYIQSLDNSNSKIRSFQIQNNDIRKEILWGKLHPIQELICNKNIAIVDEAIFTGATLKVVCEMLRECNVNKIYICIPTPRCNFHCEYLVHPMRKMLLEYLREEMLPSYFDADDVFFQNENNFRMKIPELQSMCMECFFGKENENE